MRSALRFKCTHCKIPKEPAAFVFIFVCEFAQDIIHLKCQFLCYRIKQHTTNADPKRIIGTGAGTGIKAATDIDKEHGLSEAGGYPLITDWNDPRYIGHGLGHRDPKTGEPIAANIHIPTDGELNPQNYISTMLVEDNPEERRQRIRDAFLQMYNKKSASLYRANMYGIIGLVQCKTGAKTSGERHLERAKVEREAYNVDHSEIHFR